MKLESVSLILDAMIATLLGRIDSLSGENASMFHCESVVWSRIIYILHGFIIGTTNINGGKGLSINKCGSQIDNIQKIGIFTNSPGKNWYFRQFFGVHSRPV